MAAGLTLAKPENAPKAGATGAELGKESAKPCESLVRAHLIRLALLKKSAAKTGELGDGFGGFALLCQKCEAASNCGGIYKLAANPHHSSRLTRRTEPEWPAQPALN
jgi:hypothetical protein